MLLSALLSASLGVAFAIPSSSGDPEEASAQAAGSNIEEPLSASRPLSAVEFLSLGRLQGVDVSADGASRVVARRTTDWDSDEFIETLVLIDPDGRLTHEIELPEEAEGYAWSPDGTLLAIDMEDEESGKDQVFLFDLADHELMRLTEQDESIHSIQWSPDGRWIYYLSTDAPDTVEAAQRDVTQIVRPYYETVEHRHLWRVAVDSGASERVTGGRFSVRSFSLSASGAILIRRVASRDLDAVYDSEVWVAESFGASFVRQTRNDHPEYEPAISPDGRRVAWYARSENGDPAYVQNKLFVYDLDSRETRALTHDATFEVDGLAWTPDGQSIVIEVNAGLRSGLVLVDAETGNHQPLLMSMHRIRDWDIARTEGMAYALLSGVGSLGDIWRVSLDGSTEPERLTTDGSDALAGYTIPEQEVVRWQSTDGTQIEGLYIAPLGSAGEPAPLIVFPHGGPRSSDQFDTVVRESRYAPVFAANGYGMLFVNYRGSTGYGDAFMQGMQPEYFGIAHEDVLSGVDAMIAGNLADPDHLIIMGWSAGGHMTNKVITVTDRFAAAFSGAGVIDFATHHLTSDTRMVRSLLFGANAWDRLALEKVFSAQSLLPDLHQITTPTLIMTGEEDERVHPSQSIMLFHALRQNGVDTRLFVLPDTEHSPESPSLRLFRINAALDWFAEHRNVARPGWEIPPIDDDGAALLRQGAARLAEGGTGAFLFDGWDGPAIPVFFHVPEQSGPDSPILFVAHGTRRNAEVYRDQWIELADAGGFVVIAPQFNATDFPGSAGYNLGNVFRDGDAQSQELWSFSALDPLFDAVAGALESSQSGFIFYGHSAGAQFVHRHLLWHADSRVERYLPANAGWYTMPDWGEEYPYGLTMSGLSEDQLAAALQRDVVILLGDRDNDPNHASLRRTPEAMEQGAHRFMRGQAFFAAAEAQAERLGVPFGWQLQIVEGAAHSNDQMAVGARPFIERARGE